MGQAWSRNSDDDYQPLNDNRSDVASDVKAIKYKEIRKATKKIHRSLLLGKGTFVYKGWIDEQNLTAVKPGSGIAVAITIKNTYFYTSLQHKEWVERIHKLGQLRHPNLVNLIGYSFDKERIVVHEFMNRGSLDNHLFQREHGSLSWETRMNVAKGAARALAFLHGLELQFIHRTVDTAHILLDADFNAKLSDCGLTSDNTHETGHAVMIKRWRYLPPDYKTGHLSTKCDVHGFGVVLLELISGLRVFDRNRPEGKCDLINWARPYLNRDKKGLSRIMDSRLEGQYPPKEAYIVAKIAMQCVSHNPKLRPNMSEVVDALEKL